MPLDLPGRAHQPAAQRPTASSVPWWWRLDAAFPTAVAVLAAAALAGGTSPSVARQASDSAPRRAERGEPAASAQGDPMDLLRQKLADRLGAQKPSESPSNVMRVENRTAASAPPGEAHAAPAKAPSRAAAAPRSRAAAVPRPPADAHAPSPSTRAAAPREDGPGRPHAHAAAHWDYAGEFGPDAWGKMKPEFAACATGQRQSPIDIRGGITVQLEPIQFDYRPSGFSVIDNGHTVQVNLPAGNAITVLGRRYELKQFHFHRPSEERINGRQFDMVAHLVHQDAEGRLAVVAVLLDRGVAQPVVQAVWNALPLEKGEDQAAPGAIDLNRLLPEDRRYYTYMGSLTTPPCTEGVLWMVMKTPVPVSPEQVQIFSHLYPMNARPVQSAAGRLIKESN
ncbi:MAG: carbonic anhydrase family protein [Burkholderiales bacterium]|nr:carbonic anhydrase family protein [Burkholderiales bacterium]